MEPNDGPPDFVSAMLATRVFTEPAPECVYHYTVYHYTTIEGVVGICKSRTIWATDLRYMNDTSEYTYSDKIIEEAAKDFPTRYPGIEEYGGVWQRNPIHRGLRVFAACFCQEKDLLSQWRAYAHHSTGYAIEFSWGKLRRSFPVNRLGRVEYDEHMQKEILDQVLSHLKDANSGEEAQHATSRIGAGFINALFVIRGFLKSPTFREEKEWRIIAFPSTDTKQELYRARNGILVPYCALPIGDADDCPITKIVVGPGMNPKAAEHSLRRFLDNVGLTSVAVEASTTPLSI